MQWTLFRQASEPGEERKGWANQNVWMGHAAVTSAKEHLFAETFARGGVGQAGVTAEPFRPGSTIGVLRRAMTRPALALRE